MIRSLLSSGLTQKCRTIDKLDIFNDGSCKALYRLDGNANDESGNYHGIETNITYGGGIYDRGAISTSGKIDCGAGSKVLIPHNSSYTTSGWMKRPNGTRMYLAGRMDTPSLYGEGIFWESDNKFYISFITGATSLIQTGTTLTHLSTHSLTHVVHTVNRATGITKLYLNGIDVSIGAITVPSIGYDNNLNTLLFSNYDANNSGQLDQVRFFNRAITATEVATLYAECAPTSIVDNINPFEDGSLKALYQFEDNANDSTGVYNGTPTNVTYGTGKFGKCAIIATGKINLGSKLLMPSTSNYSVSCWIKRTDGLRLPILNRMNSLSAYGDNVQWELDNKLMVQLATGIGTQNSSVSSAISVTAGTWHHVVFCIDRAINKLSVYLNGNYITMGAITVPSSGYDNELNTLIGGYHNASYSGTFDQCRVFNKALTPIEVASLYNETTPLEEPMHSLVDPFKDGSGKALYRLEGNALDESGNYNGAPTALTYGLGRFGRCGIGNGSTTKVKADFQFTTNMTISCFAYFTLLGESQFIFGELDSAGSGTSNRVGLGITTTNTFQIALGNGTLGLNNTSIASGVAINTWYHFALVISGTSVKLYKDSILVADLTSTVTIGTHTTGNFSFFDYGNYGTAGSFSINGRIDQCRVFNKALSQAEVTALYNEI